jgi:hypothetical protein
MIDSVKSHDLMGALLANKITFLDDIVFGDVKINLSRRTMHPIKPSGSKKVGIGESYDHGGSFGLASL